MSTWAIGDVQGCARTLSRVLDLIRFDPAADRVWFVGDLVNRGPSSRLVLRTVMALGDRAVTVLGNHDLHLLARAASVSAQKRRDTLGDVLDAQDRDEIVAWLRARPLIHREPGYVLVHAGIPPTWTLREAERRARGAEKALRGPAMKAFLRAWRSPADGRWTRAGGGVARAGRDAAVLTTLRLVDERGRPNDGFSGPPGEAPRALVPWFRARGADRRGTTIVFGHWAALGWLAQPGFRGIDTGCVWGGSLTAVRIEDGHRVSVPMED
ncbi:MAG: symmetrical bis(5'-nucleosyl)-tetraphosphatase [Planctomycetes bacterium]|nr:symmetrical bis(5'-nucleosyl)-tetraphosphatase [Planctomycetota bacterium]